MRPVFLKPSQIDRKRWDQVVTSHGKGNFYCLSWYLDSICKEWNALVLGDYDLIMPVPTKAKGFFKICYQPFFSRQLGIIGQEPVNETLLQLFLESLPKNYGQVIIGLDVIPDASVPGYSITNYPFQQLELDKSPDSIRSKYSDNATRILKKLDSEISYKEVSTHTVVELFTNETAGKIEHMGKKELLILQNLCDSCVKQGIGKAIGAFDKTGKLLAAGFFIVFQDTVCYLKGASTSEGKKNGAMYGIMDYMICHHCTSHSRFDFGGSRIPSIATFFQKFGANDHYYSFIQKNQPFLIHLSKQLYHKLSR